MMVKISIQRNLYLNLTNIPKKKKIFLSLNRIVILIHIEDLEIQRMKNNHSIGAKHLKI
jgi:hypothetical protein